MKRITKNTLRPSVKNSSNAAKSMLEVNFKSTVPRDNYWYQEMQMDNPAFWESESAYLGAVTATDAASAPPEKLWYEKLVDIYGAYQAQRTASKMQSELARQNMERAKAGLSPINIEDYARYSAPQVNVGLSDATKNLLIYGGLALGGIFLVTTLMKRR